MYVPPAFESPDRSATLDLIEASPFATVVTAGTPLQVSHVPVFLERDPDGQGWGLLEGHLARRNPHWECFDGERETLFLFHGPHAYVSPHSYARNEAPPTWNYAVVHAYGRPTVRQGAEELASHVDALVERFESRPLTLSEPAREGLLRGIVGFEARVERVEAKFKLGQNRSAADRRGTVDALERGDSVERELAAWTRRLTALEEPDEGRGPG